MPYGGFQAVHITATASPGGSVSSGTSPSATTAMSTDPTTSGTKTQKTSSKHTNAAMPMATGNAQWALGGLAAVIAVVGV